MKIGMKIIITGMIMFVIGLLLFYSTESSQMDQSVNSRILKNAGTFVGISGIGFIMAGILSHLINKNEPSVEKFEV